MFVLVSACVRTGHMSCPCTRRYLSSLDPPGIGYGVSPIPSPLLYYTKSEEKEMMRGIRILAFLC